MDDKVTIAVAGRVSQRTASDLSLVARATGKSKSEIVAEAVNALLYGRGGTAVDLLS